MQYLQEWSASGVDAELTRLNVRGLQGADPYDYLLYAEQLPRRNDGRLRQGILKRYAHLEAGGWWCSGVDLLSGTEDSWGCFKPSQPRHDPQKDKFIKYEHPPKTATGVFALRVPQHVWDAIAHRYNHSFSAADLDLEQPDQGFWQWLLARPDIPLCITEGAKKAGALLTAGYVAVALPGVHGGYRTPRDEEGNKTGRSHLIPQLELLTRSQRPVYIVFDQDQKPTTIQAVNGAIRHTAYLLQRQGCAVNVVTWNPELGKGVDDLLMRQGNDVFDQAYKQAPGFETWKTQTYSQLTYPAALTVNQRYLPALDIPAEARLIGIKSPKGTGKTHCLEAIVKNAIASKRWVLVIGHRVRLVESLCQRFGLRYISELNPDTKMPVRGYGLCIDSLHPNSQAHFQAADWRDGVVIIDEIEQVLWHGLNSSTCRGNRVAILKALKTLMQNVLGSQGQVYVADADLSDVALDYLRALAGVDTAPYIVQNHWQPESQEAWTIHHYDDPAPDRLVQALEQHIQAGGKPFVCLSAQKLQSQWGTSNLESYLQERFQKHKILRLDSETLANAHHPAAQGLQNLDERLQDYDIVLSSPCLETGVSIDLRGHFTSVWAIAQGIQAENSVRQALSRVREAVPRHLWVAPFGFNTVGNGSTSISGLLNSGQKLTQLNIRLLQQSDLIALDDLETGFQAESLLCWARLAVRCNAAMANYRETVLGALAGEGHRLQDAQELPAPEPQSSATESDTTPSEPSLSEAIAQCRDRNYLEECEAIATAADLAETDFRRLKKQLVKTPDERRQFRKYELYHRYGQAVTPELVQQDDQDWHPKLRLHYYLTVGHLYLQERDKAIAQTLIMQGEGAIFAPDFNQSQLGAVVGVMERLGIPALLADPERELRCTDPDLIALQGIALQNREGIKAILGIGLAKNSTPIVVVRRLLDKIGYKLNHLRCESVKQPGTKKKKRIRVYQISIPADGRSQVFDYWLAQEQGIVGSAVVETSITKSSKSKPPVQPNHEQLSLW
ncbi:MAG: DUF3854 domain-containing protein [Spirulina sp. SIO3F2]|nr:DUF3854 domain-containing protein [Spirulina sp. SIO3F2]